jgi:hypothetical protein
MSISTALTSIRAWFSGLFTKETKPMTLTALLASLIVGGTTQLTASEASTFTSSDDTILTVDANGLVTAIAAGTATVTATSTADATQTATVDLTVTAIVPAVEPVTADTTVLEKLEALIEKLELETVKEVKAGIAFLKALV